MQVVRLHARGTALAVVLLSFSTSAAWAIPSPVDHVHDGNTVDWQRPGSPALPWTNAQANANNHQHLTNDSFDVADRHAIYGAWDDRSFHFVNDLDVANALNTPFGHGLIRPDQQVRYYVDNTVPVAAKSLINRIYADWITTARRQFLDQREAWDAFAMGFESGSAAQHDIHVSFVNNLGAYGSFHPGNLTIQFETNPSVFIDTGDNNFHIRQGDAGPSGRWLSIDTAWSYDGTPDSTSVDFDYSNDGGSTWHEAPPVGFPQLNWEFFGSIAPADKIDIFEMDFATIARHEIGHSIGLDHVQNSAGGNRNGTATAGPNGSLMRWDIGESAHFGNTHQIDGNSQLAAAIDYTYSFNPDQLRDFGDAPDSYQTYLASNGPRYQDGVGQRLGLFWDQEPDGQPTVLANGDDISYWSVGNQDDEDGVILGDSWVDVILDITRPGTNHYSLRAWWDLNRNGQFDHLTGCPLTGLCGGELFIDTLVALDPGNYLLHFDLGFDPRPYYSRFRLRWVDDLLDQFGGVSANTDIAPWGEYLAADGISHGEVEDYYAPLPTPLALLVAGLWLLGFRSSTRTAR